MKKTTRRLGTEHRVELTWPEVQAAVSLYIRKKYPDMPLFSPAGFPPLDRFAENRPTIYLYNYDNENRVVATWNDVDKC